MTSSKNIFFQPISGFGYAKLEAGQEISFDIMAAVETKYFMLLRYSLYQLEWFSQILPQGREISDWSGNSDKDFYLKSSDQPMQWLFSVTIYDSGGQLAHALTFTVQDLTIGNAQFMLSKTSFELKANVKYTLRIVYEDSSKSYGQPWPLLLDSVSLMLDYTVSEYFQGLTLSKKLEVFNCFSGSKDLSTTYNLPSTCEVPTFTIDLQIYKKALSKYFFLSNSV